MRLTPFFRHTAHTKPGTEGRVVTREDSYKRDLHKEVAKSGYPRLIPADVLNQDDLHIPLGLLLTDCFCLANIGDKTEYPQGRFQRTGRFYRDSTWRQAAAWPNLSHAPILGSASNRDSHILEWEAPIQSDVANFRSL